MANRVAESEYRNYEPAEFACNFAVGFAVVMSLLGFLSFCRMMASAALIAIGHG